MGQSCYTAAGDGCLQGWCLDSVSSDSASHRAKLKRACHPGWHQHRHHCSSGLCIRRVHRPSRSNEAANDTAGSDSTDAPKSLICCPSKRLAALLGRSDHVFLKIASSRRLGAMGIDVSCILGFQVWSFESWHPQVREVPLFPAFSCGASLP